MLRGQGRDLRRAGEQARWELVLLLSDGGTREVLVPQWAWVCDAADLKLPTLLPPPLQVHGPALVRLSCRRALLPLSAHLPSAAHLEILVLPRELPTRPHPAADRSQAV